MSNDIFSKTVWQNFNDIKAEQIKRQEDVIMSKEKQIQEIGQGYDQKVRQAKTERNAAISHIKYDLSKDIEIENKRAALAISKMRHNHEKTYDHIKKTGEERIKALAESLEQKRMYYLKELNKVDKHYRKEAEHQHKKHLSELESRQDYNELMYKKAEDQAHRAIELRENEIVKNFISNPTIPGDSFYQLSGYQAELSEDPHFYTLQINVPEHERKNLNVIVKQKQITISAQRAHNKKHEGYGRKIETHNYQSTRDVLALPHPVDKNHVHESYDPHLQVLIVQVKKA